MGINESVGAPLNLARRCPPSQRAVSSAVRCARAVCREGAPARLSPRRHRPSRARHPSRSASRRGHDCCLCGPRKRALDVKAQPTSSGKRACFCRPRDRQQRDGPTAPDPPLGAAGCAGGRGPYVQRRRCRSRGAATTHWTRRRDITAARGALARPSSSACGAASFSRARREP